MSETNSNYQPESKPNQNEKTKNWLFARLKYGMGRLFYGKEYSQTQKNQERENSFDSQKDKVYFPPSATIQIDVTPQQNSREQMQYLAEFTLTSGEILKIFWDNQQHKFAHTGQNIGGLTIQARAATTLQIKSIHGGICTFDQRVCFAQDAYSRPNEFNQPPSESREELALERLKRNPRFSKSDEQSPYGYLDTLPIRGVSSERLAGGVYVGSQKAREVVYIPAIGDQTPALNRLYKQIIERKNRRGDNFAQYVLQDVVELVRAQMPYRTSADLDRVKSWLEANQLNNDGLINLDTFAQYQIGSCTHLALTTALLLETLIENKIISGHVRVEKTYQSGIGSHASVTYTSDTHEIQIDPTKGYIGKRTKMPDGWNYDVTFRMNRQERKALEKTCKAAKLPQRQQDAHRAHKHAWQKHDVAVQRQPEKHGPINQLSEPLRSKVELSLRKVPVWIVENMDLIGLTSDDPNASSYSLKSDAYVDYPIFKQTGRIELRCNERLSTSVTQKQLDEIICHEIGGHVIELITWRASDQKRELMVQQWMDFFQANQELIKKDRYAKEILNRQIGHYEDFLSKQISKGKSSEEIARMRIDLAAKEFWADRMSEYLRTCSGDDYHQSYYNRNAQFTDEENRKCWQFCSMIYQSGKKLFTRSVL